MTTSRFLAIFAAALVLLSTGPAFAAKDKKDRNEGAAKARNAKAVQARRSDNAAAVRVAVQDKHRNEAAVANAVSYRQSRNAQAVRNAVQDKRQNEAAVANAVSYRQSRNAQAVRNAVQDRRERNAQAVANSVAARRGFSGKSFSSKDDRSHYKYAFRDHEGWSRDREYFYEGHHYHWYDNAWFIIDPGYYDGGGYGPGYYAPGGYANAPIEVRVQQVLAQDGYYNGPIDGVIGPGTSAAIAAYQRDNGLRVTGTITNSVLSYMGLI